MIQKDELVPIGSRVYNCVINGKGNEQDVYVWEVVPPGADGRVGLRPVKQGETFGRVSWVESLEGYSLTASEAVLDAIRDVQHRLGELQRLYRTMKAFESGEKPAPYPE